MDWLGKSLILTYSFRVIHSDLVMGKLQCNLNGIWNFGIESFYWSFIESGFCSSFAFRKYLYGANFVYLVAMQQIKSRTIDLLKQNGLNRMWFLLEPTSIHQLDVKVTHRVYITSTTIVVICPLFNSTKNKDNTWHMNENCHLSVQSTTLRIKPL